jgi:hypothetical protein
MSKSNKPKIGGGNNGIYAIINTSFGYTRRGCGYVSHSAINGTIEVISRSNGADGDAGRIGTWDDVILEISDDYSGIVRIVKSGGNPSSILHIQNGVITPIDTLSEYLLWDKAYVDMIDIENEKFRTFMFKPL